MQASIVVLDNVLRQFRQAGKRRVGLEYHGNFQNLPSPVERFLSLRR